MKMTIETAGRVNDWISSSTDNNMMVYFLKNVLSLFRTVTVVAVF